MLISDGEVIMQTDTQKAKSGIKAANVTKALTPQNGRKGFSGYL